jgi:hypothetical protein
MGLDYRFDVQYEPDRGHPDKPYVGRFNGSWVVSAPSLQRARQLLFRFHNRRTNPAVFPVPAYMVRDLDGADYYPSGDLAECRRVADELGGDALVVELREVEFEKIAAGEVVYRAGGSDPHDVPNAVTFWTNVDPATLRVGDHIELPPTETRTVPVVVQITGYTGRQVRGRTAEFTLANLRGETVGSTDLPLGDEAILVFDYVWADARRLNQLWTAAQVLSGEGLFDDAKFDDVRRRVQGETP